MTRTAVRRHVDLTDGRLTIRKIVVETSRCREVCAADEPVTDRAGRRLQRLRHLKPGTYAVRVRETHLL